MLSSRINFTSEQIGGLQKLIPDLEAAITRRVSTRGDAFTATIAARRYTDRAAVASALAEQLVPVFDRPGARYMRQELGEVARLGGHTFQAHTELTSTGPSIVVAVAGVDVRPVRFTRAELAQPVAGHAVRLENVLANLDTALQTARDGLARPPVQNCNGPTTKLGSRSLGRPSSTRPAAVAPRSLRRSKAPSATVHQPDHGQGIDRTGEQQRSQQRVGRESHPASLRRLVPGSDSTGSRDRAPYRGGSDVSRRADEKSTRSNRHQEVNLWVADRAGGTSETSDATRPNTSPTIHRATNATPRGNPATSGRRRGHSTPCWSFAES